MPCNSSYMEPDHREREMKEAAQLMLYVLKSEGREPLEWVEKAANHCYGDSDGRDTIALLCERLRNMTEEQRDKVVYGDLRNKTGRRLADWWERHLENDKERKRLEKKKGREEALRDSAKSKLTDEEREALGL